MPVEQVRPPVALADGKLEPVQIGIHVARSCDASEMLTVEIVRPIVRAAWGPDTRDPDSPDEWRSDNPARDQCGVTALVVQDLLGGDLILGEVHVDGAKIGYHYWNQLPDGTVVDLTADQFHVYESVTAGNIVHRPPDGPKRCREQYELLRSRVCAALPQASVPN